jgi:hypothetical protein
LILIYFIFIGNKILLFNNNDVPGVFDQVIEVLIEHDINLFHFALGRISDRALGAIIVDKFVNDDVITKLNSIKDIINVKMVNILLKLCQLTNSSY